MNKDIVKGKWLEIKGEVQKAWGKLTNDELDKTEGDMKAVAGLIQKKYGETKDGFQEKLDGIYKQFVETKETGVENIKSGLRGSDVKEATRATDQ
jgi:uncharacterized protein YjbJ (UPF0337 family)